MKRAPLALIVAMNRQRVIGKDGGLPWHISEDLKHFKRTTLGHSLIMGRKTYDSIGRPLPKRRTVVVSCDPSLRIEGCEVVSSVEEAIAAARQTDSCPFVVGGAAMYAAALPWVTRMYITEVDLDVDGDVFFPDFDRDEFHEVERTAGEAKHVTFVVLER